MIHISIKRTIASIAFALLAAATLSAEPIKVELDEGFTPDPYTIDLDVSVSDPSMVPFEGSSLDIYIDVAEPHVVIEYGGGGPLYFEFIATGDITDPVLIVVTPDQDSLPLVNDDLFGLNPGLVVEDALPGEYSIGIGSWVPGEMSGTLYVSGAGYYTEDE